MASMSRSQFKKADRVLSGVALLPLEGITKHAKGWRSDIQEVRDDLALWWIATEEMTYRAMESVVSPRLPSNDPLLLDKDGNRLSDDRISKKLQDIIDSWI